MLAIIPFVKGMLNMPVTPPDGLDPTTAAFNARLAQHTPQLDASQAFAAAAASMGSRLRTSAERIKSV